MVVFLVAMDYEIKNIFSLSQWKVIKRKPFKTYVHKTNKKYVIIQTGIGKANAAAATQYVLTTLKPKRIINIGAVGCINTNIPIGQVTQISESKFFDVDCTMFGYELGQIPQCETATYTFRTTITGLPKAKSISGDAFISDISPLASIIASFAPDFIDMELAAIAHTLFINNKLHLLESYKAPSDYANASSKTDFYANEKIAFKNLKTFASSLLTT